MFKRALLAATFCVALGTAGIGLSNTASAHGCGYGGYSGYGYYPAYGSYYAAYPGNAIVVRNAYYPPVYPVYYGGFDGRRYRHHDHHHHRHNGVTFTFGF
jgi:hypothetical protein